MKHNLKQTNGFTLIEMLVSMVLLSMVLLIATSAYSLFSDRWNGRLGHFNKSLHHAKQIILVQESLKSIVSYVVTNEQGQAKLYFEGNRNGFVAVTLNSIYSPGKAAVIRLEVAQNPDFTYRLIYQESSMVNQLLINAQQRLTFGEPIILFERLSEVEFHYFGWPSVESKNWTIDSDRPPPEPASWYSEYNSLAINLQPQIVRIEFTNEQGEFVLQEKLAGTLPGLLHSYADVD